jgi:ribose transport system substrate-binding protein
VGGPGEKSKDDGMTRKSKRTRGGLAILFCLFVTAGAFAGGSEEANRAKGPVVGLSIGAFTPSGGIQMIDSVHQQSETYIARGWMSRLLVQVAGEDVAMQIAQIRNLVANRVNLLLVSSSSAPALFPVIREAQEAGVLCIIFDQPVDDAPCLTVTMDEDRRMGLLVDWLAAQVNAKGNIVYLGGAAGQPQTIARDASIEKALAKYPNIKVLSAVNGDGDEASAQRKMTDLLNSFPNIDGVLAQDGMSLGILRAFDETGRRLLPMTGETQVAFIKEWKKRKDASGFSTIGVESSPGAVCTSLGIGLRLLRDKKLKTGSFAAPNVIQRKPVLTVDNGTIDQVHAGYRDSLDSFFVNVWYAEKAIDELFQ